MLTEMRKIKLKPSSKKDQWPQKMSKMGQIEAVNKCLICF